MQHIVCCSCPRKFRLFPLGCIATVPLAVRLIENHTDNYEMLLNHVTDLQQQCVCMRTIFHQTYVLVHHLGIDVTLMSFCVENREVELRLLQRVLRDIFAGNVDEASRRDGSQTIIQCY